MKIKNLFAVAVASLATSFAFADQGDVVITFSTPGPDKYADGTQVADREWYALCWTANESFGGFKTDGSALVAGDEVVLAAPLAKDGKCPFTAFEFPQNDKYNTGKFSIFLLDTRDAANKPATDVKNVFVKCGAVATSVAKGSAMSATAAATEAAGGASVSWAMPTVQSDLVATVDDNLVTISAFEIVGANVQITVNNFDPAQAYVVKTGASIDKMNSYKLAATGAKKGEPATFVIPKENGKFFSVGTLAK